MSDFKKRDQKKEDKSFRLNTEQFFLTYPQCEIEPQCALDQLTEFLDVEHYLIAQEKHEDGEPHLHCWIKCTKKYNIKNANKFDLQSNDGTVTYHGNYQGCRSNKAVIEYCTKEGHYVSDLPKEDLLLQVKTRKSKTSMIGAKLLEAGRLTSDIIEQHPELLITQNL